MRRFNFFLIGGKVGKLYPVAMLAPFARIAAEQCHLAPASEVAPAAWCGAAFDHETQNGGPKGPPLLIARIILVSGGYATFRRERRAIPATVKAKPAPASTMVDGSGTGANVNMLAGKPSST